MIMTSTKSWKHYMLICHSLECNDIPYVRYDSSLCVKCTVSGKETDQKYLFSIDPSKMLIDLYSPLDITFMHGMENEAALALCLINNKLSHGGFSFDADNRSLFFRMTTSFYETNLNGEIFGYMLSSSADTIDEYYPKLKKILI